MLIVNDYEVGMIEKLTTLTEAQLAEKLPVLVVTRGAEGATIFADGVRTDIVPLFRRRSSTRPAWATPSAAGCCAAWRPAGRWALCGQVAALAATYCLEHVNGPQNHDYTRAEFLPASASISTTALCLSELF